MPSPETDLEKQAAAVVAETSHEEHASSSSSDEKTVHGSSSPQPGHTPTAPASRHSIASDLISTLEEYEFGRNITTVEDLEHEQEQSTELDEDDDDDDDGTSRSHSSHHSSHDDDDDDDNREGETPGQNIGHSLDHAATRTSIASAASRPPDYEVLFGPEDADNPKNWPLLYRAFTILSVSYATWVVVLYSTSYTATMGEIMAEFGIGSRAVATLGLTSYLLGLAAGCVVVAPLSEVYGRKIVYLVCLAVFMVLIVPCALAKGLGVLVGVRFVGALFGSALISNSPGTVVDIATHDSLAAFMSWYSIAPINGPVTGPLIGGYVGERLGWRWNNWLSLILAGAAFVMVFLCRETYAPALLRRKAALLRRQTGDARWWSRFDQRVSTRALLRANLSRPFILAATEPILWFFNLWLSIVYGILYLCFVAYPIVFSTHRGWSPAKTGLSFLGIGAGTLLGIALEPVWRRLIAAHAKIDPLTNRPAPESTALVMTIGAVLTAAGQLAFSWTCLPADKIPAVVPIAMGLPFGMGNTVCFVYGSHYLAGVYGSQHAASAGAGNAVLRSVFGAVLPLAGTAMYEKLTPRWAGTLLGGMGVVLIAVPWAFYRYGEKIREKSPVVRKMREEMVRQERRAARRRERERRDRDRDREEEKSGVEETREERVEELPAGAAASARPAVQRGVSSKGREGDDVNGRES